ncbi:conserved protein of unknown function [Petrocella atlantisensis]|uniref:Divalent-cation tolerance protein CutA n=1 Tax=Petrocella atlantisensis TaxID=2173034 RepID=A0A3P7PDF8_9FIRM|nr:divalent-cation tolerance protein CutA [Petrocella atlantisensis]MCF8019550.1 divalent-cation tolerance protein CutA [Vallitaleaceae bacterium]PKM55243.1 MAG: hypothetical protein CVV00_04730 [Firmicutes bacterium HGW-Firmicutes-5]VDN46928.1 conserved protein of unknown function [Petrocella atlantisensis]
MEDGYIIIMTTSRDYREADYITKILLEEKLAACIHSSTEYSHYFYNDKLHHDEEIRLMIKTKKHLYEEVERTIKGLHSYELPEIIVIPIENGSKEYLHWIDFITK